MRSLRLFCILLLAPSFSLAQEESDITTAATVNEKADLWKPIIKFLHYDTNIENRYATTLVSSSVANPANKSQEVSFGLVLPETAFISGFVMVIKDKEYNAYVKEKEEAKQEYDAAVAAGQTAAHIKQDVRNSNRFEVSVNVEAEGKVLFKLTYEELLSRTLGVYKNVINVNPGQIVKNLIVKVNIKESVPITHVSVPKFHTSNEISDESEDDKLAKIEHDTDKNPNEASVTWAPSTIDQINIAKDGINGQLIVEYDVSRNKPSQILLDEGYFVHFFTPNESAPALAKHVVFVLDISGSMNGRKIDQLKEAMLKILSDLNENDYFSIALFSEDVVIWSPEKTKYLFTTENTWNTHDSSNSEISDIVSRRTENEILLANEKNINDAKTFINKIFVTSATNIMGGLRNGLSLATQGQTKFSKASNSVNLPQPIIVFLTDGEPNVEVSDTNEIIKKTVELNEIRTPIYSLAFGEGADLQFLRRLSLKNQGFARNIYEASDAALQLNNFYKEISSPLLADVDFNYLPGQVENGTLTKHKFPVLFRGSEIVIAGKLANESNTGNDKLSYDFSAGKNSDSSNNYTGLDSIIFIDYPLPVLTPETNKSFGHLEKLWGYLTIKQLLDKDTSKSNDPKSNSPEKQEALKLALKYSFVTPLTSLVVIKPNKTDAVVEPEKASSSQSQFFPMSAGFGGAPGAGGLAFASYPVLPPGGSYVAPVAASYGAPLISYSKVAYSVAKRRQHLMPHQSFFFPGVNTYRIAPSALTTPYLPSYTGYNQKFSASPSVGFNFHPTVVSRPLATGNQIGQPVLQVAMPEDIYYGAVEEMTTAASEDSDATDGGSYTTNPTPFIDLTPVPFVRGGALQIPVENITWLANFLSNPDHFIIDVPTIGNLTVGHNETDNLHGDCSIPNEFNGYCRHLEYCTLNKFSDNIEDYVKYFCPITNGFAGVCCPPNY